MKIYVCGAYDALGGNVVSTVKDLETISKQYRKTKDYPAFIEQRHPSWRVQAEVFLTKGYHNLGGTSKEETLVEALWRKFDEWLEAGASVAQLDKPFILEFEEPQQQFENLPEDQMLRRVNEEFLDGTLLAKTEVLWDAVFDTKEDAPLRQKLASASLFVPRRGKTTLYTRNYGALYSGRVATVYDSWPSDMQSSAFNIQKWKEIGENRKEHAKAGKDFIAINKILLENALKGGCTAHNEVLAVLRPKALLGLFYQGAQRKKKDGARPEATDDETRMYAELCAVQKEYQSKVKVHVFRFDYETTKFHLPDASGGLKVVAKTGLKPSMG